MNEERAEGGGMTMVMVYECVRRFGSVNAVQGSFIL